MMKLCLLLISLPLSLFFNKLIFNKLSGAAPSKRPDPTPNLHHHPMKLFSEIRYSASLLQHKTVNFAFSPLEVCVFKKEVTTAMLSVCNDVLRAPLACEDLSVNYKMRS